jgi:hypothetical protein
VDAFEGRQLSCKDVFLRLVVAGVGLQHPERFLSLFIDVAVIEIHCSSDGACAVPR